MPLVKGRMQESAPMKAEPHPGIKGWLPPYHVQHADLTLSQRPAAIQGTPRRHFTRGGIHPALSILSSTPPVFAYLLAHLKQTPNKGASERMLVAQVQKPIGVYH